MKKKLSILLFCLFISGFSFAQTEPTDFTGRDPQSDLMNFVPNEILVKFKDNVQLKSGTSLKSAGIQNVDQVLKNFGMENLEKLFPTETKLKSAKVVKDPQGRDMIIPSLHNIYKIVLPELKSGNSQPVDVFRLVEELKILPEVEYAEPNYIYSIDNLQPVGPALTPADLETMKQDNTLKSAADAVTPNDPLYEQQWYIPAIKANLLWAQTTGGSDQVIAILDTGVDTEHPDLKNKIWQNSGEIAGNGIDDDGNGLIDDVNGWDYINNDNDPKDDNSHGTHVAGIAAAETDNGIGIAGVNWQAKIMPLKVFQSSGHGDVAKITQAIIYATQKGATVINMSFGSYSRSLAMEDALANAYVASVLVAAAGNDATPIGPCYFCKPFFPAALSFVLGVEANKEIIESCGANLPPIIRACFSNYDQDGPTFSGYDDLLNYEMKAPGVNIISTIPNGNYRIFNGTSMAAPLVAGAVSLYRNLISKEDEPNELMWVKLIQATSQHLDIFKALTIIPKPELWFLNNVLVDTIGIADEDGRVDAGETIQLWFRARNTGGQVDSVYWKIQLAEFEDKTTCDILKPTSYMGSVGPYATLTSEKDPMKIKINSNVAHDRDITFDLLSWYKGSGTLSQRFVMRVENGEELSDLLEDTLIITSEKKWLISGSFKISPTGVLIIKPGTKLQIDSKLINDGKIIAIGKPDSLIHISGKYITGGSYTGNIDFSWTELNLSNYNFGVGCINNQSGNIMNSTIVFMGDAGFMNFNGNITDSKLANWQTRLAFYGCSGKIRKCNFLNIKKWGNYPQAVMYQTNYSIEYEYNNFNNFSYLTNPPGSASTGASFNPPFNLPNNLITNKNNYELNSIYPLYATKGYSQNDINQYWGTSDSLRIGKMIFDFFEDAELCKVNYSPFLKQPTDSAHAIVWKILVNGKDAQDEVVEPVGVGKQRFDVYFNRPMNKSVNPNVAFGVRYPFSSNPVNEESSWSEDGRIFKVYKTIKLTTGDGINRIRVTGAKDLDGWEIPVEDMRFEFLINATSSASNEFMATPGLGKVALEWNDNDLEDGLGYNMYRMEHINDSTLTEPVIINSSLITDTLYSDYAVVPNKKYFYYYKILRTNLTETDSSKIVAAIPFTAALGDANGDLSVNVLDVTTIVAYLLNQNPQPFIFEAADVNGDGQINVLDIVATVNKVLNPGKSGSLAEAGTVNLYLQNDTLFADATVPVGAIQFDITGVSEINEIERLAAINGFESGFSVKDNTLRLIVYSLTGKTIAAGNHIPLLRLKKGSGITNMIMGDKTGSPLTVNYLSTGLWNLRKLGEGVASLGQNYPNPFNKTTTIPVIVSEPIDELVVRIINITGQEVAVLPLKNPVVGENLLHWNTNGHKGMLVYRLEIMREGKMAVAGVKKMIVQ